MDTATDLLQYFYDLRTRFHRQRPQRTAHRKEAEIGHIEQYLAWCEANKLPPRLFMEKRFESIWAASHKRSLPRPNQLCSEKLKNAWRFIEERHFTRTHCERVTAAAIDTTEGPSPRELRADPLPHQERVKQNHADDRRACLTMLRYTGGYHPKSPACASCPEAVGCCDAMNTRFGYDVAALRAGNFHKLPSAILQAALG